MPPVTVTTAPTSQLRIYAEALVRWLCGTGLEFDGFPLYAVFASPEKAFGHVQQILAETQAPAEAERWKKQPMGVVSVQYLGHVFDPSRNRGHNSFIRNAGFAADDRSAVFKTRHPRPINVRWQIDAQFTMQEHRMLFVEWLEGEQNAGFKFLDFDFSPLWKGWGLKTVPLAVDGVTDNSDLEVGEDAERLLRVTVSAVLQGWYFWPVDVVPTVQGVQIDVRLAPSGVDLALATAADAERAPFEPDAPDFEVGEDGVMTAQAEEDQP